MEEHNAINPLKAVLPQKTKKKQNQFVEKSFKFAYYFLKKILITALGTAPCYCLTLDVSLSFLRTGV